MVLHTRLAAALVFVVVQDGFINLSVEFAKFYNSYLLNNFI